MLPLKIIAISLIALSSMYNPLNDTHWRTEDGLSMYFSSKDTVTVFAGDENQLIAKAVYTVKDTLLTWRDIETQNGTCDTSLIGNYVFKIDKDHLSFRLIADECSQRSDVIEKLEMVRVRK
jgi:hypothetical protein